MSALLPGLAVVAAALLALGPVAWIGGAWLAPRGSLGLCAVGVVLALAALLGGTAPAVTVELPVGLPGSGILVALDGLSALFLLLLFLAGAAASAVALDTPQDPAAPVLPVLLGAMAATFLAADGFSVVLGFELAVLAAAALVLGGGQGFRAAAPVLGGGVAAGLALVAAMALLAPLQAWGFDLSFAGMRAHPPEGVSAAGVLVLVVLGAGGAAGLAPLHRWLPRAQAAVPGPAGVLFCGALGSVGLYLLARVLFDLSGPAQPGWWGALPVLLGAAGAVLGATRAVQSGDIREIPGAVAVAQSGLVCVGFGLAFAARATDQPLLAALALGAALLLAMAHGVAGTLLALAAGAAEAGGGSRRLDRLGGLLRGMPATTLGILVAAASVAALPPSIGFAAVWTLLQALIGAARAGGTGWQAVATVSLLATAAVATLAAVAMVRLVGVAFLGRPRTPRAAAAQEAKLPARAAMLALAGLTVVASVVPGLALALAEPALRLLLGVGMAGRAGVLGIAPAPGAIGLQAAAVAVLLGVATAATLRLLRVRAAVGHRAGAAWEGAAAPPPPWLPFGDPTTQLDPDDFAGPLGEVLAVLPRPGRRLRPLLVRWRRLVDRADAAVTPPARGMLAALLVAALLLLLAAVLVEQA